MIDRMLCRCRGFLGVLLVVSPSAVIADEALMAASTAACDRLMQCMTEDLAELPQDQRAFFMQALEGACRSFSVQGLDMDQALTSAERRLYLACTDSLIRASCEEIDISGAETPACERFNSAMEERGS